MKLIDYINSESGTKYPRIIGYNYYNDPEFYIAYRKKGEENWNGRCSMPVALATISVHVNSGYEFREKDLIRHFFN